MKLFRTLVEVFLVYLPQAVAGIILLYYAGGPPRNWLQDNIPIVTILDTNGWLGYIVVPLGLSVPLYSTFTTKYRSKQNLSQKEALYLLEVIHNVVGTKLRLIQKSNASDSHITIDQSNHQIKELVTCIYLFFRMNYPNHNFEICLAKMGNEFVEGYKEYIPTNAKYRCDPDCLLDKNCGFSVAMRKKRMLFIDDVQKEGSKSGKKNFVFAPNFEDISGSIVLYPVKNENGNDIPYVISVFTDTKNFFKDKQEKCELLFSNISTRIYLEQKIQDGLRHD